MKIISIVLFICVSFSLNLLSKDTFIKVSYVYPAKIKLKNVATIYLGEFDTSVRFISKKEVKRVMKVDRHQNAAFSSVAKELKESIADMISEGGVFEVINSSHINALIFKGGKEVVKGNEAFSFKAELMIVGRIYIDIEKLDGTNSIVEQLELMNSNGAESVVSREVSYPFSSIAGAVVVEYDVVKVSNLKVVTSGVLHRVFGAKVSDFVVSDAKNVSKKIGKKIGKALLGGLFGQKDAAKMNRAFVGGRQNKGDRERKKRIKKSRAEGLKELAHEASLVPVDQLKDANFVLTGAERGLLPAVQNVSMVIKSLGQDIAKVVSPYKGSTEIQILPRANQLVYLHLKVGNFSAAKKVLLEILGQKKIKEEDLYHQGVLLELEGKYDGAMEVYDRLSKLTGDTALLALGRVIRKKMDLKVIKKAKRMVKEVREGR